MKTLLTTALLGSALALGACGGDDDSDSSTGTDDAAVNVATFSYDPDPLVVEVGTKVTWTNEDQADHTVTSGTRKSRDGKFDGPLKASGGTFSQTFDKPGTYNYFCSLHSGPGMTAKVVVG